MSEGKCFQITVEGSGELFQVVRDALDTQRLISSNLFKIEGEAKARSLNDQTKAQ